jgi:hypothetical protein
LIRSPPTTSFLLRSTKVDPASSNYFCFAQP